MNTMLAASINAYKRMNTNRAAALDMFTNAVAKLLGKKPVGNPNRGSHMAAADKWNSPMAYPALFGGEAREFMRKVRTSREKEMTLNSARITLRLATPDELQAALSIYDTAMGIEKIKAKLGGLGDAIWASYAIGVDPKSVKAMQQSDESSVRFAGHLVALAYTMAGVEVEQTEKGAKRIAKSVGEIELLTDFSSVFSLWADIWEDVPEEEKPEAGSTPDSDSEAEEETETPPEVLEELASKIIEEAIREEISKPQDFNVGYSVTELPLAPLPRFNLDAYIESDARIKTLGQYSGAPSQLYRVMSDQRCFAKKRTSRAEFGDMVGIGLDISGSMRGRINRAVELHDKLAAAFTALEIPFVNCAYKGDDNGKRPDEITPLLCGSAAKAAQNLGGNGDLGAILWLTKEMSIASAKNNLVIMIADGCFVNVTQERMVRELENLQAQVIHVNFISGNPFNTQYLINGNSATCIEEVFKAIKDVLRL